ncbi:hypothetical protein JHK87_016328 [Glycine soja]|nr:hypothetical protein JHK87_016328 [Glycine soja]
MRVKDARMQLVRVGRDLLIDPALLGDVHLHRRLCAAAWIAGEYVETDLFSVKMTLRLLNWQRVKDQIKNSMRILTHYHVLFQYLEAGSGAVWEEQAYFLQMGGDYGDEVV